MTTEKAAPTNRRAEMFKEAMESYRDAAIAERTRAEAAERESIRLAERLKEAREALQELVDCKDMHDRIENRGNGITADEARELGREYRTRRPLAWDRARALLRSGEGE